MEGGNWERLWHWQWPFQLRGWPCSTTTFQGRTGEMEQRSARNSCVPDTPNERNNRRIRRLWQRWRLLLIRVTSKPLYIISTCVIWFHMLYSLLHGTLFYSYERKCKYIQYICMCVSWLNVILYGLQFRIALNNEPRCNRIICNLYDNL